MCKSCSLFCQENLYLCFKAHPENTSSCSDPFPTSGQVSPLLLCLLHIVSVVNIYVAIVPCPLCAYLCHVLCRLLCRVCWGGTALKRREMGVRVICLQFLAPQDGQL